MQRRGGHPLSCDSMTCREGKVKQVYVQSFYHCSALQNRQQVNYKAEKPGLYKTKKPLVVIIFTTEYKSQNALILTLVKSLMWFYTHLDKTEWYKNIYKIHRQLKSNTCKGSWGLYSFHLKCCCSASGTSLFAQGTFTTIKTRHNEHYYYHHLFE